MRIVRPLNFNWKYKACFNELDIEEKSFEHYEQVNIPHSNIELPYNNFNEETYAFVSCYKKVIKISEGYRDKDIYISFEGVANYAKVYVNGKFAGEHKGGYTPFDIKIDHLVEFNEDNIITVVVDSTEREEIPPFGNVVDYLTYGGIYREVSLKILDKIHIDNIYIKTEDVLKKSKKLNLEIQLSKTVNDILLEAEILDKEGKAVKEIKAANVSGDKIYISEKIKDIELWDIENPNLYTLNIRLVKNHAVLDCLTETFGFRKAEFKTDGFYLNNKKIKLRGLNRHQSFCNVGYAMPKSMQEKDAEILKYELGANVVRTSHYPQSKHFINRCDEIGLLVFTEIPGWQHISENEEWRDLVLKNTEEMILRDRNHPSIIIWGVRINESQDCDELYAKTNNLAHLLDPTRATGGVRNFAGSTILENVYTYNDFVHTGKNKPLEKANRIAKSKKIPYLVSEHNGHMYPTKRFDHEVKRIEHALRHMRVLNEMYGSDRISGAIGWCMFDYNTHKDFGSGDRICYHGVMDMFRIPKLAAYVYSSQQEEIPVMEVASNMEIGDYAGGQLGKVNIFTNCDYVKFYKNDEYIGKFYPDRKKYKYVPHPPVVIDDFIGRAIEENERFNPKEAAMVKEVLLAGMTYGMSLPMKYKAKALYLMIKTKITPKEALDLYGRYIGNWGGNIMTYRFEAYIDHKLVKTVTKTASKEAKLEVSVDSYDLIEDNTYDVTRIVLSAVSENGNLLNYAGDPIMIETEGPIEVIGDKLLSLKGGAVGFYIKTIGHSGKAKVKIVTANLGKYELEFNVVKAEEKKI